MINVDILRYIDKEMSKEEITSFEEKLKNDSNLQEEYEATLAAKSMGSIFLRDEILSHLDKHKNTMPLEIKTKSKVINYVIGIAATLLVLFIGFNFLTEESDEAETNVETTQFASLYIEPIWDIERGEANDIQTALSQFLSDNNAENALKTLNNGTEVSVEKKYWIAEILVNAKKGNEARPMINELIANNYNTPRCHYLMVMSYIADNNTVEAKNYITKIGIENFDEEEREKIKLLSTK